MTDYNMPYTIDVKHTQHGWIALFSNDESKQWTHTAFTRHARGCDVESALRSLNPNACIIISGGR